MQDKLKPHSYSSETNGLQVLVSLDSLELSSTFLASYIFNKILKSTYKIHKI